MVNDERGLPTSCGKVDQFVLVAIPILWPPERLKFTKGSNQWLPDGVTAYGTIGGGR